MTTLGGDPMTTITAPAPAEAPTVPPVSPLTQVVILTVLGAVTGCLGVALVWHDLWQVGGPLAWTGAALCMVAAARGAV
jgi:hypothetical protein